ncbi:MAG: hypothetical protein H7146_03330 [Burkholderiaceae bacterium]|nr:hypothetical protein [Microbacteriaceae bacterium]
MTTTIELGSIGWVEDEPGLWLASALGMDRGTVQSTAACGFVVRNPAGEWLASFSQLRDAQGFLAIAARLA